MFRPIEPPLYGDMHMETKQPRPQTAVKPGDFKKSAAAATPLPNGQIIVNPEGFRTGLPVPARV